MVNNTDRPKVLIKRTAHGKPYYERIIGVEEDVRDSPMHDALDFPGKGGRDEFEATLKDRFPGIEVRYEEDGLDFVAEIRSIDRKVDRDEFIEDWRHQSQYAYNSNDYSQIKELIPTCCACEVVREGCCALVVGMVPLSAVDRKQPA